MFANFNVDRPFEPLNTIQLRRQVCRKTPRGLFELLAALNKWFEMSNRIENIASPGVRAEGPHLQAMRKKVAALLQRQANNFPGAQPVSFARRHLKELRQQEYVMRKPVYRR